MASVIQFVDSIAASPTVRLDLNSVSSNLMVSAGGIDLSPPPFREAVASTLLQDGDQVAAGAFGNRTVKLPLKLVYAASTDAAATAIQNLARELNRPRNILKVQLDGATSPVFFRTYRAPNFVLSMLGLLLTANTEITLEIPAEYAAYGLLETPVSAVSVSTDPAAGSNGCFVDVTGVKGDVESPALISFPGSAVGIGVQTLTAVRRRGTPANTPFFLQAEAMTQGTNTTVQANDANFSGSGNNYSRCTFTTASDQIRLSTTTLGTSGVDLRGRYRVFLRYRKNTSGDGVNIRLLWGDSLSMVENDIYATPASTSFRAADLGEISLPFGFDPIYAGDGTELSVSNAVNIEVRAERTSGTGTVDFDVLVFVPADDRLAITEWANALETHVLDARDTSVYVRDGSNRVVSSAAPHIPGGYPLLSPNQTNRIFLLRSIAVWTLTTMSSVSVSYYPRYLTVRPAST
jgi:hypothetical protein